MRVLVFGGRKFADFPFLEAALGRIHLARPITLVIHGGAPGADSLGGRWARLVGVPELVFLARWDSYHGVHAGRVRNQRMLDEGRPEFGVGFPGGPGTADMTARAERARLSVWFPAPSL